MNKALKRALKAKDELRTELAALPIEEKIRILIRMQKRANEIRKATGRPLKRVWEIKHEER